MPVSAIVVILFAEHIVCEDGVATAFGVGFTTTVAEVVDPVQVFAVGVNVKVTVTGALVVFVNEPVTVPPPLEEIPVTDTLLSLVHVKVVPLVALEGTISVILAPEQIV